jgi:hypothetical protein
MKLEITRQQMKDARAGKFSPVRRALISLNEDLEGLAECGRTVVQAMTGAESVFVVGVYNGDFYYSSIAVNRDGNSRVVDSRDLRSVPWNSIKGYLPLVEGEGVISGLDTERSGIEELSDIEPSSGYSAFMPNVV